MTVASSAHDLLDVAPLQDGSLAYIYATLPKDEFSNQFRDAGFMKVRFVAEVDNVEVGVLEVRWIDGSHFRRLFPNADDYASMIPEMWSGYAHANPDKLRDDYKRHLLGLDDPFVTWAHSDRPRVGVATALYKAGAKWLASHGLRLRASTGQSDEARALWESFSKKDPHLRTEGGHHYLDYRASSKKIAAVYTVQDLERRYRERAQGRDPQEVLAEAIHLQNQECVRKGLPDLVQPLYYKKADSPAYKSKKKVKNQDGEESTVYEYSDAHVKKRTEKKVDKVNGLTENIDKVVAQAKKDLKSEDPKVRMPALAVLLIDHTYERVGNEDSASDGHYGVTTWKKKHLKFSGKNATLSYVGKSGVKHEKVVTDPVLVRELKGLASGKADDDFLFCDKEEECATRASEVNDYLSQHDITSKDLRGYHANRIMLDKLKALTPAKDDKDRKRQFLDALDQTAEEVGHEASTLRSQYLAPSVEKDFMDDGKVNKTVRASDNPCNPTTVSYAWIAPDGAVHVVDHGTHDDWAWEYVESDSDLTEDLLSEARSDASSISEALSRGDLSVTSMSKHLLKHGWVRVNNSFSYECSGLHDLRHGAKTAFVELLVSCVVSTRRDPEQKNVYVTEGSSHTYYSPAELVKGLAGRRAEEDMFGRLLAANSRPPRPASGVTSAPGADGGGRGGVVSTHGRRAVSGGESLSSRIRSLSRTSYPETR